MCILNKEDVIQKLESKSFFNPKTFINDLRRKHRTQNRYISFPKSKVSKH